MDSDYYEDRYVEEQAEYDMFYRENMKLTDGELINNSICLRDDLPEETPEIVCGIIDYHSKCGKITEKQRGVLVNFLTDMDVAWN